MRERIKQIVEKMDLPPDAKLEELIEHVVRECSTVAKKFAKGSIPNHISLAIKHHFGIHEKPEGKPSED